MKTPREKYESDPAYRMLVDVLVDQISKCNITPSEVREAAILACIIYERNYCTPEMIKEYKTINEHQRLH